MTDLAAEQPGNVARLNGTDTIPGVDARLSATLDQANPVLADAYARYLDTLPPGQEPRPFRPLTPEDLHGGETIKATIRELENTFLGDADAESAIRGIDKGLIRNEGVVGV